MAGARQGPRPPILLRAPTNQTQNLEKSFLTDFGAGLQIRATKYLLFSIFGRRQPKANVIEQYFTVLSIYGHTLQLYNGWDLQGREGSLHNEQSVHIIWSTDIHHTVNTTRFILHAEPPTVTTACSVGAAMVVWSVPYGAQLYIVHATLSTSHKKQYNDTP